jgi:hypothetical protein
MLLTGAAVVAFLAHTAGAASFPTIYEQFQLEIINRARANPDAEVVRLSGLTWSGTPDLNEGLAAGTITNTPKQPLAFNTGLIEAARTYSQQLLDTDTFEHQSNPDFINRIETNGYTGWTNLGENLSALGPAASITTANSEALTNNLFVDRDYPGRGHRITLMDDVFREIGIGIAQGPAYAPLGNLDSVVVTQNFGTRTGNAFLTGVAFLDNVTGDSFYTPGEGLGNVTVTAVNTSTNAEFMTTTWAAGGYTLQLAPGTYNVTFSLAGFQSQTFNSVVIGSQNVKLDYFNPVAAPIPEPAVAAMLGLGVAGLLVFRRRTRAARA